MDDFSIQKTKINEIMNAYDIISKKINYKEKECIKLKEELLYESEYRRLKESTSLLELALWKIEIDNDSKAGGRGNKKIKIDLSEFRLQCRVSCGADHVVENVWPYLLPPDFVRAFQQ